jgi:two-component system response regulator (stage 0 sporulation protein A)
MEPNMLKKIEELIEVIREKEEFRIEIIVTKSNNKNANLEIKDLAYDSTKNKDIIKKVTEIIKELGVPVNCDGYNYIRDCVVTAINNPETLKSLSKSLYPEVAKQNSSTVSKVERCIRNAIEVSWKNDVNRGLKRTLFKISTFEKKPTNSYYICTLVDYIKNS